MEKGEVKDLTKEEFIAKIASNKSFAKKYGELKHIYGEMWRKWPAKDGRKIDQVQWLVDQVQMDPDCHNALINSWNPEYLYEMAKPNEASRFPICHNMYQVNVKEGKLSLQLYQRTADMFLGVPFNIASYALLTMILAKVTGNKPGEFIHTFGDAHIYENHINQVKQQLRRKPFPFPKLTIHKDVKTIDDFRPEHAKLRSYKSHDSIRGTLKVTGGLKTKSWEKYTKKN
jgi:thymidylate synthase